MLGNPKILLKPFKNIGTEEWRNDPQEKPLEELKERRV